jgi:hypothetical protein
LPYLRFSRDKRGNEITSLLHTPRRGGKARPQILYWFRTPPNVKVGRAALDESAIRAIEEGHPEIEFDWPAILGGPVQAEPASPGRDVPPKRRDTGPAVGRPREEGPWRRERGRRDAAEPPATPGEPDTEPIEPPAGRMGEGASAERDADQTVAAAPTEADTVLADALSATADLQETEPSDVAMVLAEAEDTPALGFERPDDTPPPPPASQAVLEAIGAENAVRLRARYAELLARISERVVDPARREELREGAERLNPDAWVTPDDVRQALEDYEAVYASIRRVVGERRRRSRRGGARRGARSPGRAGVVPQSAQSGQATREASSEEEPDVPGGDPSSRGK